MPPTARMKDAIKAALQLGLRPVSRYAAYQFKLRSGILHLQTPSSQRWTGLDPALLLPKTVLALPDRAQLERITGESGLVRLRVEADEIVSGNVRLFGGDPVPLKLSVPGPLRHWTEYERGRASPFEAPGDPFNDIKFIWEPGRFGWAILLGRAYWLTQDERYPDAFWRYFEEFQAANPPYLGPHWMSAQEAAIRLIGLVFSGHTLAASRHSTPDRLAQLGRAIAEHAARIPPTLAYAQSQNNNHLLTEAAGLFTAGLVLPDLPEAPRWRELGWRLFHSGLQSQISPVGVYIQHSANYQRLMLQIALWVRYLGECASQENPTAARNTLEFPPESRARLAAATRWLLALVDEPSGRVPNLGPNDGAHLFPLCDCPFFDYRPTLQAAARAWLDSPVFPPGSWDELAGWMGKTDRLEDRKTGNAEEDHIEPAVLRSPGGASWAYFRAARFSSRPGHADQLHLDLWWRGLNVAQDAGTYLYNALPPWDNALAHTAVHNTVTLDGLDQMKPAGRFLWLDWAQAEWIPVDRAAAGAWERRVARHNGYRQAGVAHQRAVTARAGDRWVIEDKIETSGVQPRPAPPKLHTARVHWLLPDWPLEIIEDSAPVFEIRVQSPYGPIRLRISCLSEAKLSAGENQIVRAGEVRLGKGPVSPTWGWISTTYGVKLPALSVARVVNGALPLTLTSEWEFPQESGLT